MNQMQEKLNGTTGLYERRITRYASRDAKYESLNIHDLPDLLPGNLIEILIRGNEE